MSTPKYVERLSRLPAVLELLLAHPDGLSLRDLARDFDVDAETLREDLLAFFTADVSPELLMGLTRPSLLEFVGPDGDEQDPENAEVVRISDPRGIDELGVAFVDASELALIYTAATSLLDVEPDDDDLAAAVAALTETMLGEPATEAAPAPWNEMLAPLVEGQQQRRRVDIVYSRAWRAGVSERTIEPYRFFKTRRGWEIDAGPLDENGALRTFLVSNVREARLREETFEPPADLEERIAEQRRTVVVRIEIPQSARWAADLYAEKVAVVHDGETSVELEVALLPPLRHRLGLLLLAAGPDAQVLEPPELADCRAELARQLAEHHAGPA